MNLVQDALGKLVPDPAIHPAFDPLVGFAAIWSWIDAGQAVRRMHDQPGKTRVAHRELTEASFNR